MVNSISNNIATGLYNNFYPPQGVQAPSGFISAPANNTYQPYQQTLFYPFMPQPFIYAPLQISLQSDPEIAFAMQKLEEVKFNPNDVNYLENLGARIKLKSGKEAADFIKNRNISVQFGPVDNPAVHAQWSMANNAITINEKYKGTKNMAEILAISEAIMHETGHALDEDYYSSIQEEIDCLSLNTLANRYHQAKYPQLYEANASSDIIGNGVYLYTKLFFDPDNAKKALIARISEKYGELPVESPKHRAEVLALKIKENYLRG